MEWLRSERPLTTRDIAEAFEVSRRTIFNDLDYLRKIGVPIVYDRKMGTYTLKQPFESLPLLPVSRAAFAAFLVAQHALEVLDDTLQGPLLAQVVRRIAKHLPETVRVPPEVFYRATRAEPGSRSSAPIDLLQALEAAVRGREVIRIRYTSDPARGEVEREAEPYVLITYQGRWYVIAYCRLRKAVHHFRVDRIRALTPTGELFSISPDFDLDAYLGPAYGMQQGGYTYDVHVRFSADQARWIREEQLHASQEIDEHEDGTLDVRLQTSGLQDLTRWILSYGAEVEVLTPPVLREHVATEARRMVAVYAES